MKSVLAPIAATVIALVALVGGAALVLHFAADTRTNEGAGSPPPAVMRADNGARVQGATGTYCWHTGGRGICVDAVGPVTNVEPISLGLSEDYKLEFGTTPPDSTEETWLAANAVLPSNPGGAFLIWSVGGDQGSVARPTVPGKYLLLVYASWDAHGSASYGFYVELR